jgi:hypothetical protein
MVGVWAIQPPLAGPVPRNLASIVGTWKALQGPVGRSGDGSEDWCRGLGPPRETIEDLFDHRRIFDARDRLHRAAAVFADLDIDPENPLQPLRPRHRDVARGHGPIGGLCLASATSGPGDLLTQSMIRRKDAVVAREVDARRRHQSCLPDHDKSGGLPIWTTAGRPQGGAHGCPPSIPVARIPCPSCHHDTRGETTVLSRAGLEATTCERYRKLVIDYAAAFRPEG